MNESKKLKIWTLLCHALIIVGAGHGAAPLVIFELVSFVQSFDQSHSLDKLDQAILLFGVMAFVGQVCLIASIFTSSDRLKRQLHVIGILLLFCATAYIGIVVYFNPYSVLLFVTCLPFIVCLLLTLLGSKLSRLLRSRA